MVFSVTTPAAGFLHPRVFLSSFQFADDHERQYARKIAKRALDDRNRIYLLSDELGAAYGFVAISIASAISMPCVVVDYLFTSLPYRKKQYAELGNRKVSEHLLDVVIMIARETNVRLPVHYVVLQPAHEKLEEFYKLLEFKLLHLKDWMFLKI